MVPPQDPSDRLGVVLILALGAGAWAHPADHQVDIDLYGNFDKAWDKFRKAYNKTYSSRQEAVYREQVFRRTFQFLRVADEEFKNGTRLYGVGVNYFADMTLQEVERNYTGYRRPTQEQQFGVTLHDPLFGDTPESVDWKNEGLVTPVKFQGQCRACWAFSAVGALEGQLFKRSRRLVDLSEQNLLDCAGPAYGNNGCIGGRMVGAFQYVRDAGGLDTEAQYPYRQSTNFQCQFSNGSESKRVAVTGYVRVPRRNERALMDAVTRIGPISIAINARPHSLKNYRNGIYNDPNCDPGRLTHAVLLVGYGEDARTRVPYWIVKNSWGAGWGERGYIRIVRNQNLCGLSEVPIYPTM